MATRCRQARRQPVVCAFHCSPTRGSLRAPAPPAGVVVQGMAAPIAPVMERDDPAERLAAAKKMLDQGLISQSDFDAKKKEILTAV